MSPEIPLSPEAAVSRFLQSLAEPARILVAISGGSDSTGLLVALAEAVKADPHSKFSLCAATVDHDLRAGSADEARDVAALCQSLSIPHRIAVWHGAKPKSGIMAAAREARYALLAETAAGFGADLIVTAHTLDDQRETLIMRGKRGSAGDLDTGIADAVLFDRSIWIARPLLASTRGDIRRFLTSRGVGWSDDPSNDDIKYERVQTRAAMPSEAVARELPQPEGRAALADAAADWLTKHFTLCAPGLGRIAIEGIAIGNPAFAYALGRLGAVFGGQSFVMGAQSLQRLLTFLGTGEPGRVTAGRVVFDKRRDGLYLSREDRGILPLSLSPGTSGIWDGRFRVFNGASFPIRIEKSGGIAAETPSGSRLPKSALKRALAAQPAIFPADDANVSGAFLGAVALEPYFAPFDRFLTRFDFIFAGRLTAAFGTRPYPTLPLGLIDGKTT